jgi:aminoglycoside phosphotransferase (APT) family kinase protein
MPSAGPTSRPTSDTLPDDILDALTRAGFRPVHAEVLTLSPDPLLPRALYRVAVDGGVRLKARRFESDAAAALQQELMAATPPAFARILSRRGAVLIEEWVDGLPVTDEPPLETHVRAGGSLLATLHRITSHETRTFRGTESTAETRALCETRLARVHESGALDAASVARLLAVLEADDPGQVVTGLTHRDLCGENMVVDAAGTLRVIDNERMIVGPLALDLARTWYRWNLSPTATDWLAASYTAGGGLAEARAHQMFWRIVGTTASAIFRIRSGHAGSSRPVECLRHLAAECSPA